MFGLLRAMSMVITINHNNVKLNFLEKPYPEYILEKENTEENWAASAQILHNIFSSNLRYFEFSQIINQIHVLWATRSQEVHNQQEITRSVKT